jgi:hypothetical protein
MDQLRRLWLRDMKRFLLTLLLACNSSPGDNCDAGCVTDGGSTPPISGGGCDTSKPPSQGGCAVDDTDGYFVSPSGSDTASGAKATPFKTVGKGVAAATATPLKPNVYVCAGTYPENLVIQGTPAGVALHGGFDCTSWAQVNAPTTVSPPYVTNPPPYPLHVLGAAALVESMTLIAPDVTDPGVSSLAVLIDSSVGVTFRRATVLAGKAGDGVTPTAPQPVVAALNGNNGAFQVYGAMISCSCTTDVSIGGQGGGTTTDGGLAEPEAGAPIVNGDMTKGQPGTQGGSPGCNGGNGSDGLAGKTGNSTGTYGGLTPGGWKPSPGGAGIVGGTAQGGAGGWWNVGSPAICGGGGACGGCGGAGGGGGSGGGASVAVGVLNTPLRIRLSTLRAGVAGNGGDGGLGQLGQPGGSGGTGTPCYGGSGGTGGAGGAGGGGAGGIAVGIAMFNTTPDVDSQSSVLGGTAGKGGHDGSSQALKAIDGIADAMHSF